MNNPKKTPPPYAVSLTHCASYTRAEVEEAMRRVLTTSGLLPSLTRDMQVLVKPNLLRAELLCCTHAEVMRALCLCLQEHGVKVRVMDSPGFGSTKSVAHKVGHLDALAPLGLSVEEFSGTVPFVLPDNLGTWQIGREAFSCDCIISVPRLKVHKQMRMTLAVKNLFGCIVGLRKALAHTRQGISVDTFSQSILALYNALPPTAAVLDGIVGMHRTGPAGGDPFPLHCLGASIHAEALDTAIYSLLKVPPELIPLWKNAQQAQSLSAFAHNIHYTDMPPSHFDAQFFDLPNSLMDISFQPHKLLISYAKRIYSRWF